MIRAPLFIFIFIASYTSHLFNDDVVELNSDNFDSKVVESKSVWIVMFYAPWCGHCKNFAPDFSKASSHLKGLVKFGSIDLDKYKDFGSQYQIKGFPTVKIFSNNKRSPIDYNGERTSRAIAERLSKVVADAILERLNVKSSGKSDSSSESGGSKVVKLNQNNFYSSLTSKNNGWLVEFFAPWCGHCKNLEPHFNEASMKLDGIISLGAVDATVETQLAAEFGVKGFPTIYFFPPGSSFKPSEAIPYDGGRTADGIVTWVNSKMTQYGPEPEVVQLTDEKVFETNCRQKSLCLLAFLPPIYDSSASERNDYIDLLKKLASKERSVSGWVWAEGTNYEELERVFNVGGYGYPALLVISNKKSVAIQFRGQFTAEFLASFIKSSLGSRVENVIRFTEIPQLSAVTPWDGKDYVHSTEL